MVCFHVSGDCIVTAGILKLAWVSYSVFFLLEMQNVILSLSASDPTWINSEMIWAIHLGGFSFLLPSSQLAKQELYSGSLVIILTGLGGLSSL